MLEWNLCITTYQNKEQAKHVCYNFAWKCMEDVSKEVPYLLGVLQNGIIKAMMHFIPHTIASLLDNVRSCVRQWEGMLVGNLLAGAKMVIASFWKCNK